MTSRFNSFIGFIFEWEGTTFENDPSDPGGATKYGIDQRSHPGVDIKNLTREGAEAIYFEEWTVEKIESMPEGLGEVYFNACVNCGQGRANKLLALSSDAKGFLDQQDAFYRRLVEARPNSLKFLKGWLNRTAALRRRFKL
jgi:lysozyme family protein